MKSGARIVSSAVLLILLTGSAGAKDIEIKSTWASAPVKVDGTAEQWGGHLFPLPDNPMLVGVQNDGENLYICIKTSDPKVKGQLTHLGLTVWVNGEAKDLRAYGARFPVSTGFSHQHRGDDQPPAQPPEGTSTSATNAGRRQIELIGPTAADRTLASLPNVSPILAALGDDSGVMVIELAFPLKPTTDFPQAVKAEPGATIALGLETEPPQARRSEGGAGAQVTPGRGGGGQGGGMPGGTGRGGGRGMGPGGMGGGMARGEFDRPDPIRLWFRVQLAAPAMAPTPSK
jgi:hypothetical protein